MNLSFGGIGMIPQGRRGKRSSGLNDYVLAAIVFCTDIGIAANKESVGSIAATIHRNLNDTDNHNAKFNLGTINTIISNYANNHIKFTGTAVGILNDIYDKIRDGSIMDANLNYKAKGSLDNMGKQLPNTIVWATGLKQTPTDQLEKLRAAIPANNREIPDDE